MARCERVAVREPKQGIKKQRAGRGAQSQRTQEASTTGSEKSNKKKKQKKSKERQAGASERRRENTSILPS